MNTIVPMYFRDLEENDNYMVEQRIYDSHYEGYIMSDDAENNWYVQFYDYKNHQYLANGYSDDPIPTFEQACDYLLELIESCS